MASLWTGTTCCAAMSARCVGGCPEAVNGVSIDTRTLQPGDLFFAIKGEPATAMTSSPRRLRRARPRPWSRRPRRRVRRAGLAARVPDVLDAHGLASGCAARARTHGPHRRGHRLGRARPAPRKRCARVLASQGLTHASAASYNNHWGVPLTLARMPQPTPLRRLRDRHEPCRRDHAADADGAAARGADHHGRAGASGKPRHASRPSPTPRPRSSAALEPGGDGRHQPRQSAISSGSLGARAGIARRPHRHVRRASRTPTSRLTRLDARSPTCSHRRGDDPRRAGDLPPRQPGPARRHEQPRASWPRRRARRRPDARGAALRRRDAARRPRRAVRLSAPGGDDHAVSTRATTPIRPRCGRRWRCSGQAPRRAARPAHRGARRHAGTRPGGGRRCMPGLRRRSKSNGIDLVFAAGPLMKHLWQALPPELRGAWAPSAAELAARRPRSDLRAGDVVMVKGSNGSRMGADRRGAEGPLRASRAPLSARRISHALLARRLRARRSAS